MESVQLLVIFCADDNGYVRELGVIEETVRSVSSAFRA